MKPKNKIRLKLVNLRRRFLLIICTVPLIIMGCYGAMHINDQPDKSKITAASVYRGEAVYMINCQACHGKTGKGDGPMVSFLPRKPFDLSKSGLHYNYYGLEGNIDYPYLSCETLYKTIRFGNDQMPASQFNLDEGEIIDLSNFLNVKIYH